MKVFKNCIFTFGYLKDDHILNGYKHAFITGLDLECLMTAIKNVHLVLANIAKTVRALLK